MSCPFTTPTLQYVPSLTTTKGATPRLPFPHVLDTTNESFRRRSLTLTGAYGCNFDTWTTGAEDRGVMMGLFSEQPHVTIDSAWRDHYRGKLLLLAP